MSTLRSDIPSKATAEASREFVSQSKLCCIRTKGEDTLLSDM